MPGTDSPWKRKHLYFKHKLLDAEPEGRIPQPVKAELAIRNISENTIATASFLSSFVDIKENVVDVVEHRNFDIKTAL
jgi:hypothetical protein